MELQRTTTVTLTISQDEFEKVSKYVLEQNYIVLNSFLHTIEEPSVHEYIRALTQYLFGEKGSTNE